MLVAGVLVIAHLIELPATRLLFRILEVTLIVAPASIACLSSEIEGTRVYPDDGGSCVQCAWSVSPGGAIDIFRVVYRVPLLLYHPWNV